MEVLGPLLVYFPGLLMTAIFIISFRKEPRQFRNAIFLLFALMFLLPALLLQFGQQWMVLPLVLVIITSPLVTLIFLIANTVIVVRHEGLHLSTVLPALLAVAIIGWFAAMPIAAIFHFPSWLQSVVGLAMLEGLWFMMSFVALLLYTTLYRILPRKRVYDAIIIHGAGLMGTEPTPLLRGRINKAVDLWIKHGKQGVLVASGGQGADEEISEAEAMRRYMIHHRGVPDQAIVLEDKSTTTFENVVFSKRLLDALHTAQPYRCALVTSDYHVFRACEYARTVGLTADGVGSHTRAYYWPTAFIREFIAITKAHWMPYVVIAALWAFPLVINLIKGLWL